jgi:DNA polymerase-3 subunit gamma/tau
MRDGLSLLDQLIAFGGGKAGEEEARAMLGTIARDHVERLAGLLATMNVPELVQCARSLEEFAPDYAQVLDELAGLLVRVAMKQAISDYEGDDLYAPELLERLAKAFSPEDIQLFYQTAITGRRDLGLAPDPRTGFEMTLLRMIAFRPANDAGMAQGPVSGPVSAAAGRGGAAAAQAAIARGGGAGAAQDGGAAVAQGGGRATAGQAVGQGGGANGAAAGPPPSGGGASAASSGAQSGGSAAAAARAAAQAGSGGASAARAAALAAARGGASGGPASPRGVATVGSSGGSQQNDASLGSAGLRDGSGATVGGGLSATAAPGPGGQHDGGVGAEGESGTGASGSRGQREGAVGTESRGPTAAFGSGGQHDAGGGTGAEGQRGTGASGSRGQREGTGGASQRTSTGPGEQGNRASAGFSRGQSSDTADAEAEWLSMQHGQDEGASASQASGEASGSAASWISILNQLDLQGAARQLASHCVLAGRQPGLVRLALDPRVKFVRTSAQEEKLAQALSRHYGETVRLEFTMAGGDSETPAQAEQRASQQELEVARQALETDPGVQSLRERFGATLLPETVRPIK